MDEIIRIIKDQLTGIEHENLCILPDNNLIADYCKQIRIELEKIDYQDSDMEASYCGCGKEAVAYDKTNDIDYCFDCYKEITQ